MRDPVGEGTLRWGPHVGTYPISPPPGAEAPDAVNVLSAPPDLAGGGGLLGRAAPLGGPGTPGGWPQAPVRPVPQATYSVEGVFRFEDREQDEGGFTGVTEMRPIRDADAECYDVDSGEVLGAATTGETGTFRMTISDNATRNVACRALATSRLRPGLFNVTVATLPRLGGQPYAVTSPVYLNHAPGTNIDFRGRPVNATRDGVGGAFHVFDLAKEAQRYVENLTGQPSPVNLTVHWSAGHGDGKFYDTNGRIYLMGTPQDDDSYDDTVILHELGHYIALSYSADAGFYGPHGLAGTYDIRLAYTEGLGSYFMGAVRRHLNLSQPLIYIETNGNALNWFGFSLSYDTDTPSSYFDGAFQDRTSANEVAVGHALFDVIDGSDSRDGTPGVDDDPLDLPNLEGDRLIWNVLVSIRENATSFTKAISMETFFDQWALVNPGYASEFTQILLAHGIEFGPDAYEDDDIPAAASPISPDGSPRHHTFYPAGDEDWSVFAAVGGTEYVIKTATLLDGADTVLELYDSDASMLLAANDNRDGSTMSSLLTIVAPSSQSLYVRVFRHREVPIPIGEYGKYNLTLYVLPNPVIAGVDPSSGPVQGGTSVLLMGSNFTSGATVRFGVYDATDVVVLDGGTIRATTPANVPGGVDVIVVSPPNEDGIVPRGARPAGFTYTGSPLPPGILSITPNFGRTTAPTNVTVTGDFFLDGASLHFDAIPAAAVSVVDPRTIVATAPPLPPAVYDVRVANPVGGGATLRDAFESAAYAAYAISTSFDSANPLSTSVSIAEDFEIMDVYVYANVTHPVFSWGGVRLELEGPGGKALRVFDRIAVADATGLTWRTRIVSTFGYDEAPSEVLWQFRGERSMGNWTLHASAVLDDGTPSTLHDWALYLFRYRHRDVSRVVITAAEYRNYVTGFDEGTGEQLYRVRLESQNDGYTAAFPVAVAVARDQRHACGGGYTDYNATRGGWTDSALTCFEATTGRPVKVFALSGNLGFDGIEAPPGADRFVAVTNERIYLIDTVAMALVGSVPTGFPAGTGPPNLGITPDGRRAYVGNPYGSEVLVVDLGSMSIAGRIDTPGDSPLDVDISADGSLGIISASGSPNRLLRFDPATDVIVDALPVDGTPFQTVLTPDGTKAFYATYQWYAGFGRTDLTTRATARLYPHPESTTACLAMGRDGTLFVADWWVPRLWVYNASTEVLLKDIVVPERVYSAGTDVGEVPHRVDLAASAGDGYVRLDWAPPTSHGTPIAGYIVYRGDRPSEGARLATLGPTGTYVDSAVTNGRTYHYRVAAVNGGGEGPRSNEVAATPDIPIPRITNVVATPDRQASGGRVNITSTVTNGGPGLEVWVDVRDPGGGVSNSSMARAGGTDVYYHDASYFAIGAYAFTIWAGDASGNQNTSSGHSFAIVDGSPPRILGAQASPNPQDVGGRVNLTASVTDDVQVGGVWANLSLPGGSYANVSMARLGLTDVYFYEAAFGSLGTHGYQIWAVDTSGNVGAATGGFVVRDLRAPELRGVQVVPPVQEVPGRVNISVDVTDNYALYPTVWILIVDPLGGATNATMQRAPGDRWFFEDTFSIVGTYVFTIAARDDAGNWNSTSSSFEVRDTTPPTAVAGGNREVLRGTEVRFDGSGSRDNSGTIANYTWHIRSGTETVATLYGANVSFIFETSGTYVVVLIVTDLSGNVGEESLTVIVHETGAPSGDLLVYGASSLLAVALAGVAAVYLYWRKRRAHLSDAPESGHAAQATTDDEPGKLPPGDETKR